MSSENRWVLEVIPEGNGLALDLGGGRGSLGPHVEAKGYKYINLDIRRFENRQPTVLGSAHELPFRDEVFDVVISKDSLEHFLEPWRAVSEVYRILKPEGLFVIWVPFIHPFHGDDVYRYTHLGIGYLLRDFVIVRLESPFWVFSLLALLVSAPLGGFAGAPGSGVAGQVVHKKGRPAAEPRGGVSGCGKEAVLKVSDDHGTHGTTASELKKDCHKIAAKCS